MTKKPASELNEMLNGETINNITERQEKLEKKLSGEVDVDIYLEGIEHLKQEISYLSSDFVDKSAVHRIPVIVLETMPLGDLEVLVDYLDQQMVKFINLVNQEEQELMTERELIKKIKAQLAQAKGTKKSSLEKELADIQEGMKLLEKTLVGQHRNLKKRQEVNNQHRKILNRRKNIYDLKSFDSINIDPVLSPLPEQNSELVKTIGEKLTQSKLQQLEKETENQEQKLDFPQAIKANLSKAKKPPTQKKQWQKWTIPVLGVGVLVTFASVLYSLKLASQLSVKSSPEIVSQPPKLKGVAAVGYIEPEGGTIKVSAPSSLEGMGIEQVLVKLGDKVKAGQVLAILDSRDRLQAALEQAQREVNLAEAKLAQIKAGAKPGEVKAQDAEFQKTQAELAGQIASQKAIIKELEARLEGEQNSKKATITRIKAELDHAQEQCQRYQNLFEDGAVSEQQVEEICLQQDTKQENLREAEVHLRQIFNSFNARIIEAQATLDRIVTTLNQQVKAEGATLSAISEVRLVDVKVAQAELEKAKTLVNKAKAELDSAYIRAPRDGQILQIYTKPGEVINDEGIVDLGYTEQMYVRGEVYETDISRVKIGQKATISTSEIAENLEGIVEEIGLQIGKRDIFDTDPVAQADARVVEIKVRLSQEASEKVAQLTNLQVNVIIDTSSSQR